MQKVLQEELISVIIPAYNVEKYIERCVESVCDQTYRNLQIILVDDGSTDRTGLICDSFEDNRIHVIHQENKGLSGARNSGLKLALGRYITFVDSDDYINENLMYEQIQAMQEYNVDFCACGIANLNNRGQLKQEEHTGKVYVLDYGKSLTYLCDKFQLVVWNKLYKKEVLEDIWFNEGEIYEDVAFMRKVFERISTSAYIDKPYYIYRVMRPDSLNTKFDIRMLPSIEEFELFIQLVFRKGYKNIATKLRTQQLASIKNMYYVSGNSDKEIRKKLYRMFINKIYKNMGWREYPIPFLAFMLVPEYGRKKFINKFR